MVAGRRAVLAGALVMGLAGCSGTAAPPAEKPRAPAPGAAARKRAAGGGAALLALYDATLAAHPALVPRLSPLRAEVLLHAKAFGAAGRPAPPSAAPDRRAALTALAQAEQRRADALLADLAEAPGELARLFASVAASGAGHVLLLQEES